MAVPPTSKTSLDRGGETTNETPATDSGVDGRQLVVAIPALNEEETIAEVIRRIPQHVDGVRSIVVLVIDDGSTDQTAEIAEKHGAIVIRHPVASGVGAAFHSGLAFGIENAADLIVTIDADGQFDPEDIPALVAPVAAGQADFSTASRFKDRSLTPVMPRIKLWGNLVMSRLISGLTGQKFFDVSCGMRCYGHRAALHLHLLGWFTYSQEVILNLAFKRLRLVEIPLRIHGERPHGKSRVARSLWRYGIQALKIIFRCYRDYVPLRFFVGIAIILLIPALALGIFVLAHYLQTGGFTPHKWAGYLSAGFLFLAMWMLDLGMTGDMLNRHRVYLEELLFIQRTQTWRRR